MISTTGSLIGLDLTASESLSTLPVSLNVIASLCMTIPASFFMAKYGRRNGFLLATFLGIIGTSLVYIGVTGKQFYLFCMGIVFMGFVPGFGNYFRFAATEVSRPEIRSQAISFVLASGVIAAFIGPNLSSWGSQLPGNSDFSGGYLFLYPLYLLAIVLLLFLKIKKPAVPMNWKSGRSSVELFRKTKLSETISLGGISFVVMVLIMTATPLGMRHHHHQIREIAQVIQFHMLGMFVPSFFTGTLIKRFGDRKVMLSGTFLFIFCVLINFIDQTYLHFSVSLILLGVGWNFLYLGATTMLAENIEAVDQPKAQALNDFLVTGLAAISVAFSGKLYEIFGWANLNLISLPLVFLGIILILRWQKN